MPFKLENQAVIEENYLNYMKKITMKRMPCLREVGP